MERVVAKLKKGRLSEIWVVVSDFTGVLRLDIREYFHAGVDVGFVPTKKGLSIPIDQIPALRDALVTLAGSTDLGTVAVLDGTPRAQIQAGIRRFEGHTYAELRLFVAGRQSTAEWRPTPKGITLNPSLVPILEEAIGEAEEVVGDLRGPRAVPSEDDSEANAKRSRQTTLEGENET